MRRSGIGRLVALAFAVAFAARLAVAPSAAAAEPTFAAATATSTFGDAITLEQRVTLPAAVVRIEALVREGTAGRTFLAEIDNPGPGTRTLQYRLPTPFGGIYPNTPVELGFRLTFADGSAIDGPTTTITYVDDRHAWRTIKGDVVRIHWVEGSEAFARRALEIGDRAVAAASKLLGVDESAPIDFFVYADRDAFYDVIGPALQENVGGIALADIRTLFANIAPSAVSDPWVGIVVPHELTHVVFADATGNAYHDPPHWLNEGLADYLAGGYDAGSRSNVESAARTGDIMPLRALVGQFPATAARFSLAYDESVSAIDYLIRTFGREALVSLIRSYAGGVSDDAAFSAALGVDAAGFEAGWLDDLGVAPPVPYGPAPAPPGPLPPGWNAAPVPTPGPLATRGPIASGAGPTKPVSTDDPSSGVIVLGIAVFVGLLAAGILVAARSLNRGQPLLPATPRGSEPYPDPEMAELDAPEAAQPGSAETAPADDTPDARA